MFAVGKGSGRYKAISVRALKAYVKWGHSATNS